MTLLTAIATTMPMMMIRSMIANDNDVDDVDDNDNDDGDNDNDDEDGRDAVGVSHAAPPRLRPPDNGNLGGASIPLYPLYILHTSVCIAHKCVYFYRSVYIAQKCVYFTQVYICSRQAAWEGPGGDFRHAHDRIILSNTIVIISPKAIIIIQLNILL